MCTGSVNASAGEGKLAGFAQEIAFKNPSFAYSAAEVTQWRPRAYRINGAVVPSTGLAAVCACYADSGVKLS